MLGFELEITEPHPRFMGYSFNQKVDDILVGLVLDGFSIDDESGQDDADSGTLYMRGPFYGEQVKLVILFRPEDHIIKTMMVVFDNDSTIWTLVDVQYEFIKMKVESRYGKPIHTEEKFTTPYKENDGNEYEAFATSNASWMNLYHVEGGVVSLSILFDNGYLKTCLAITDTQNDDN